jgi:hypothetical protein
VSCILYDMIGWIETHVGFLLAVTLMGIFWILPMILYAIS